MSDFRSCKGHVVSLQCAREIHDIWRCRCGRFLISFLKYDSKVLYVCSRLPTRGLTLLMLFKSDMIKYPSEYMFNLVSGDFFNFLKKVN